MEENTNLKTFLFTDFISKTAFSLDSISANDTVDNMLFKSPIVVKDAETINLYQQVEKFYYKNSLSGFHNFVLVKENTDFNTINVERLFNEIRKNYSEKCNSFIVNNKELFFILSKWLDKVRHIDSIDIFQYFYNINDLITHISVKTYTIGYEESAFSPDNLTYKVRII